MRESFRLAHFNRYGEAVRNYEITNREFGALERTLLRLFRSGPRLGSRQEYASVVMALHILLAGLIAAAPAKAYDDVVNALLDAAHESWKLHQWD